MISIFAGLRSQIKSLKDRLKALDTSKKNQKEVKEVVDALNALEERYDKERAKRQEKLKAKEQKAQEVAKEAAPKVEDGTVVMPKKEFVEEHEKLVKELEPMVEEHKEQGAELKEVKEASPKCAICSKEFTSYPEYQKHREEAHGHPKEYVPMDPMERKKIVNPIVERVEKKLGPAIISEKEDKAELYKYSVDDKVEPVRGEPGSWGHVMRPSGINGDPLVYVKWMDGPIKGKHGEYGGYYEHDLKKKSEEKVAEGNPPPPDTSIIPKGEPPHNPGPEHVCPECKDWQKKESDLKSNYDALLKDLKEEREIHYTQGNQKWVSRLDDKIKDLEKAIREKFDNEKQAGAQNDKENLTVIDHTPPRANVTKDEGGKDSQSEYFEALALPDGRDLNSKKAPRLDLKTGDKVQLKPDALAMHSRSVPPHAGYTHEQFEWRDLLDKISNTTGEIERTFENSSHVNVQFPGHPLIGIGSEYLNKIDDSSQTSPITPVTSSLKTAIKINVFNKVWEATPVVKEGKLSYEISDGKNKVLSISPLNGKEMGAEHLKWAAEREITKGYKKAVLNEDVAFMKKGSKVWVISNDGKKVKFANLEAGIRGYVASSKIQLEALESQAVSHNGHSDKVLGQTGTETLLDCIEGGPIWVNSTTLLDANRPPATPEALYEEPPIEDEASKKCKTCGKDSREDLCSGCRRIKEVSESNRPAGYDKPESKEAKQENLQKAKCTKCDKEFMKQKGHPILWCPECLNEKEASEKSRKPSSLVHKEKKEMSKCEDCGSDVDKYGMCLDDCQDTVGGEDIKAAKDCPDCHGNFVGKEDEKCPTCGRFSVKEAAKSSEPSLEDYKKNYCHTCDKKLTKDNASGIKNLCKLCADKPFTCGRFSVKEAAKQGHREWAVRLDGHKIVSTHATEEEAKKALDVIPSHYFVSGEVVYRDIPENKEALKTALPPVLPNQRGYLDNTPVEKKAGQQQCPHCKKWLEDDSWILTKHINKEHADKVEKKADYEGWSNRSTWGLALWLDNDQSLYNFSRQLASSAPNIDVLASDLQDNFYGLPEKKGEEDMNSDEVNWKEIAQDLLNETKENTEYEKSQSPEVAIEKLPVMDVEQEKDKLIDQLRIETDPEKKKSLERRYKHLTMASLKSAVASLKVTSGGVKDFIDKLRVFINTNFSGKAIFGPYGNFWPSDRELKYWKSAVQKIKEMEAEEGRGIFVGEKADKILNEFSNLTGRYQRPKDVPESIKNKLLNDAKNLAAVPESEEPTVNVDINKLPTVNMEEEKDKIIDLLNKEQDPEKRQKLQQRYKHLSMGSLNVTAYIQEEDGKWCVRSPKNKNWNGGCYKSRAAAEKRLAEVERIKHMKGASLRPFSKKAEVLVDPYQALISQVENMRQRMSEVQTRLETTPLPKQAGADEKDNSSIELSELVEDLSMGLDLLETKLSAKDISPELHSSVEELEGLLIKLEEGTKLPEHKETKEEVEKESAKEVVADNIGQPPPPDPDPNIESYWDSTTKRWLKKTKTPGSATSTGM